jgi:hypothetical protein
MSTAPSALMNDIPANVRSGTLQHFLYTCASHGRLTGNVKTLKIDGEASLILSQTEHLRQVLRVSGAEYWIPRKTVANKALWKPTRLERARRLRQRRHKSWCQPPFWTGEPRPHADSIPLPDRALSWDEIVVLVRDLGLSWDAAVVRGSLPRPIHEPEPQKEKTRKELGEIVVVRTAFNDMSPEQRQQKKDHDALMKVLAGLRMSPDRASAAYEVIVLGHGVREVAESRGLDRKLLSVTVSKVRARMGEP